MVCFTLEWALKIDSEELIFSRLSSRFFAGSTIPEKNEGLLVV